MGKTIILDTFEKAKQYAGRKVRCCKTGAIGPLIGFGEGELILYDAQGWKITVEVEHLFDPSYAKKYDRGWWVRPQVELLDEDSIKPSKKAPSGRCYCGSPALVLFASVECTNDACRHFVHKLEAGSETGLVDDGLKWIKLILSPNSIPNPTPTSQTWTIPVGAGGTISGTPSASAAAIVSMYTHSDTPQRGFKTVEKTYSDGTKNTEVFDPTGGLYSKLHQNAQPGVTYP